MKIFVIGSYSADNEQEIQVNISKAVDAGKKILQKGHLPLVPKSMFGFWEKDVEMERIMKACYEWIAECDAVYVANIGKKGGGTWSAREVARKNDKKIFTQLSDIPDIT